MTDASIYLLEIDAHDGTSLQTLRVATSGYVTGPNDSPADAEYPPLVADPGTISRSLFAEGRTMGQSEVGFGDIGISNAGGDCDGWIDLGFSGRAVVLKRLTSARSSYASAVTLMRATATRLDSSAAYTKLALRLYDRRLELDKPIQTNRYDGTTTSAGAKAEGNADLEDKVKPLLFGRCENVPAVCVNIFNLIWQVNDGAVASIVAYDGGVQLAAGGDFTTLTALVNATVPAGKYATCLALGLFRLGSTPAKVVTADVKEMVTGSGNRAGAIALRILARLGLTSATDVNPATFAALDAAATYQVGVFIADDRTAIDVLSDVLGSVGAWLVPNALGVFEAGVFSGPDSSAVATFYETTILPENDGGIGIVENPDTDGGLPVWRVVLTYRRNWQVQDDAALAGCVTQDRRAFLGKDVRKAKAQKSSVKTKHLLAPELAIDTLLVDPADAAAEAARRLALYSVRRDLLTFSVRSDDAEEAVLGATVSIELPRLGYQDGRSMVVIGRRESPAREMVDLTLWG
jgi:hypothetical protein